MSRFSAAAFALFVLVAACPVGAADSGVGYGPWRLGMSKAAVEAVNEFGPYKEVPSTGGLETPNALFDSRKTNISFVFGEAGLRKIQIWAYEGQSLEETIDSWYRVREYLIRVHGPVEVPALRVAGATGRDSFARAVREALAAQPTDRVAKLQMAPVTVPKGLSVFSSLFRHPQYGYYVFLYYQEP